MENHFQTEAFNLDKVLDDFEQKQGESINTFNQFINQSINPPIRFALTMLWSDSLPFSLCMRGEGRTEGRGGEDRGGGGGEDREGRGREERTEGRGGEDREGRGRRGQRGRGGEDRGGGGGEDREGREERTERGRRGQRGEGGQDREGERTEGGEDREGERTEGEGGQEGGTERGGGGGGTERGEGGGRGRGEGGRGRGRGGTEGEKGQRGGGERTERTERTERRGGEERTERRGQRGRGQRERTERGRGRDRRGERRRGGEGRRGRERGGEDREGGEDGERGGEDGGGGERTERGEDRRGGRRERGQRGEEREGRGGRGRRGHRGEGRRGQRGGEDREEERNGGGDSSVPSILNTRLQLVSVPFGGARPKQPVTLKLQIPWPLSGQDQNQLSPTVNTTAVCKNKNLENRAGDITMETGTVVAGGDPGGCVEVVNGELLNGSSSLGLVLESESSPDNDLQAGCHHQGALPRKQLSSLGDVAPVWVPDSKAPVCMKCEVRFTFTKRRHHCRACGKVFCAACCSLRSRLIYMDRKEARVCITCHSALLSGFHPRERRRVRFADGILPNGEAAESPKLPASSPAPSQTLAVSQCSNKSFTSDLREALSPAPASTVGSPVGSSISLIPEDGLPPILISTGVKGDYAVEERPSEMVLIQQLEEGGPDPLVFVLNANLLAMVKLVNYVNRKCWYVTSKGMHAVGQAEVVVLLQCLPDEKSIPKDLFSHFVQLYQEALTGNVLTHLGHSFFTQSFLGSREHGGFLYKWETPWAKMFPIRLMLRLGAEYRFYPCPLFSVRFRKPLFGEAGHTIMTLLVDFRNYQYTLPLVKGLVVDMEVKKTCIKIPSNRYNELMKAMNKSNEHVLAMGACFNELADSHLVCIQNDDGNYHTQAISIHHQPRKVTGACFFVFSGSLKASSGYLAKTSIVEDGVMVQITAETMDALRQALRDMKDFSITCGWADQEYSQEHVHIQWIDDDHNFFNKGVISPIDGKSMEFITSVRIFHGSEFKADGKVIRWTEVFFLQSEDQPNGLSDPADHSRLTENVARAFCMALCPHLKLLKEEGMAKLGLRVTLESDQVGYLAGSNGQPLLSHYLRDLDSTLIPVIHRGACQLSEGPVVMELVFYILEILS
uniref:FYVE-type domain-containing protein n=1 Tax=Oncorhynchus tshawytscha TaxID=74940 RepID=A0AAZ3QAA2_ONCTS